MIRQRLKNGNTQILYSFRFSDGYSGHLTIKDALTYRDEMGVSITKNEAERLAREPWRMAVRRKKDGFQEGWQPGLGEYVSCPGEYKRKIKEAGLIEVGNEPFDFGYKGEPNEFYTDEIIKDLHNKGLGKDIGDNGWHHLREKEQKEIKQEIKENSIRWDGEKTIAPAPVDSSDLKDCGMGE